MSDLEKHKHLPGQEVHCVDGETEALGWTHHLAEASQGVTKQGPAPRSFSLHEGEGQNQSKGTEAGAVGHACAQQVQEGVGPRLLTSLRPGKYASPSDLVGKPP